MFLQGHYNTFCFQCQGAFSKKAYNRAEKQEKTLEKGVTICYNNDMKGERGGKMNKQWVFDRLVGAFRFERVICRLIAAWVIFAGWSATGEQFFDLAYAQ